MRLWTEKTVMLSTPDGPMDAFLAAPREKIAHPSIVVAQEAFGVNSYIKDICRRLAKEGYAAIAPELFHRSGRGIVVSYSDYTRAKPHLSRMTNETIVSDLQGALAHLKGMPGADPNRMGVIGFCVGGYSAFLLACRAPVAAAVCFYGGGIANGRQGYGPAPLTEAEKITARVMCFFGANDPSIPQDDVEAIRTRLAKLGIAHDVVVYPGAGHGFFCNERPDYRPDPSADAWRRTLEWYRKSFLH